MNIVPRFIVAVLFAYLYVGGVPTPTVAVEPPNVVLIISDDK